jgi:hypothetical protein
LDPAAVTNDGHRFRLESINHDLPGGSSFWDQCFVDLVDMPGVIGIVEELVADEERWHHLGARLPPAGAPASVRLSHHNLFFRPPWGADAPADRGGSLHGGGNRGEGCTISVAYELLDVGLHDGGFGWIPGSHRPEFELPSHASWRTAWATEKLRGPNWPAHCAVNRTPAAAGDAIIFVSSIWCCPRVLWLQFFHHYDRVSDGKLFCSLCLTHPGPCVCFLGVLQTEHLTHGTLP